MAALSENAQQLPTTTQPASSSHRSIFALTPPSFKDRLVAACNRNTPGLLDIPIEDRYRCSVEESLGLSPVTNPGNKFYKFYVESTHPRQINVKVNGTTQYLDAENTELYAAWQHPPQLQADVISLLSQMWREFVDIILSVEPHVTCILQIGGDGLEGPAQIFVLLEEQCAVVVTIEESLQLNYKQTDCTLRGVDCNIIRVPGNLQNVADTIVPLCDEVPWTEGWRFLRIHRIYCDKMLAFAMATHKSLLKATAASGGGGSDDPKQRVPVVPLELEEGVLQLIFQLTTLCNSSHADMTRFVREYAEITKYA